MYEAMVAGSDSRGIAITTQPTWATSSRPAIRSASPRFSASALATRSHSAIIDTRITT